MHKEPYLSVNEPTCSCETAGDLEMCHSLLILHSRTIGILVFLAQTECSVHHLNLESLLTLELKLLRYDKRSSSSSSVSNDSRFKR